MKIKQDEARHLLRFQQLKKSRNDKRIKEDDIELRKPTIKKRKKEENKENNEQNEKNATIIDIKTPYTTISSSTNQIPTVLGLEGYSSSEDDES